MSGFKSVTRRDLRVGLGVTLEENASLEVSQREESVDVVAEASVVDTTSNEVGTNFDRDWVENAPIRRNSFFDLIGQAPGSLQGEAGSGNGIGRTMVYGSSYDENSFQVDGVDITDNYFNEALAEPNVDAIEEVEVLSLGAPAEYGNLTGAVYNIVTRQGTNDFHGDVQLLLAGRRAHVGQQQQHHEPRRHLPQRLRRRSEPCAVPGSATSSATSPPSSAGR